jgi:ankyrin repeat protein
MRATLEAAPLDEGTRNALRQFFLHVSAYVTGKEAAPLDHEELAARWVKQRVLDDVIAAIAAGLDHQALALAPQFASRPSVFVGMLARMVQSGRATLIHFVIDAVEREPSLAVHRFAGRTLLHIASGAGCLEMVALLLQLGTNPNIEDRGGHTPLYYVANECASETGVDVVGLLVEPALKLTGAAGPPGRLPCIWRQGEAIGRSLARCSIAARQWTQRISTVIRHCSERLIAAEAGSHSC